MKFTIEGRFPGMNEIVTAAKRGRGRYQPYAEMKKYYTLLAYREACKLGGYDKIKITFKWYEPNSRRDIDNICAGAKFILDGMVKAAVIKDDSQRYVKGIEHHFFVDNKNPRIEIEITEIK